MSSRSLSSPVSSASRFACIWLPPAVTLSRSFTEERFFSFAEACGRFSPQIAVRGPEAVFLEIGRSRAILSEHAFEARVRALAARFELGQAQIGIADTAAVALIAAKYPTYREALVDESGWERVPLSALLDVLDPLESAPPVERAALLRDVTDWMRWFQDLGIHSMGEFARLPREALASRFGAVRSQSPTQAGAVLEAHARVHGERDAAWVAFKTEAPCIERFDFWDLEIAEGAPLGGNGAGGDLDALLFLLKPLIDRAMARLRGRERRASRVELRLKLEGGLLRNWEIDLPFAQGTAMGVLPILRDRMGFEIDREPLLAPVREMEWEVLETTPGAPSQRNWITDAQDEQKEQAQMLLGRLASRLGEAGIFQHLLRDRHLPEAAAGRVRERTRAMAQQEVQQLVRKPWAEQPERPTRMLSHPLPLKLRGRLAQGELWGGGKNFRTVRVLQGPERIVSEWWDASVRLARDYYQVLTEDAQILWVYRDPTVPVGKEGAVCLHGYFD